MSNSNRALMKEDLANKREEVTRLKPRGRLILNEVAVLLNPALQEIEEMDIAQAHKHIEDLMMIQAEILSAQTKIAQLEEALYG